MDKGRLQLGLTVFYEIQCFLSTMLGGEPLGGFTARRYYVGDRHFTVGYLSTRLVGSSS